MPNFAHAATRYWVGGGSSANWNATGNTNWGTASNTRDNASVPGAADDVIFDNSANGNSASTLSASVTINSLDMSAYTNTLTHNASVTLTIDSQNGSGDSLILGSGMTYTLGNANTSALYFSGAGTNKITTNGKIIGNVTFNNSGDTFQLVDDLTSSGNFTLTAGIFDAATNSKKVTLNGAAPVITPTAALSFYDLTITPATATVSNSLTLAGNITVTGTFTVSNGATVTNRVLVKSSALGTARTITAAAISISNADFMDITGAGAASWDMSAATGGSGNGGGNTMQALGDAAFTTAATTYWVHSANSSQLWSNAANWTVRIPLAQDTVRFNGSSFPYANKAITVDVVRLGADIDFTGTTGVPVLIYTGADYWEIYGSLTLVSGVDMRPYDNRFYGRGQDHTITLAGENFYMFKLYAFGGVYTMRDAFKASWTTSIYNGTFDADIYSVTIADIMSISGSDARTINMGSGTWTFSGTGTIWNAETTTNLTFDAETSTMIVSNVTATAKTFKGGNLTYNNVTFSGDKITVQGSNAFAGTFALNALNTNGVLLTTGTNQTIANFTSNGDGANKPKLRSTTTTNATITKSGGGTICEDYVDIDYITGSPASTWDLGTNSTDGGHNSQITFTGCAVTRTAPSVNVRGGTKVRGGVKFR